MNRLVVVVSWVVALGCGLGFLAVAELAVSSPAGPVQPVVTPSPRVFGSWCTDGQWVDRTGDRACTGHGALKQKVGWR